VQRVLSVLLAMTDGSPSSAPCAQLHPSRTGLPVKKWAKTSHATASLDFALKRSY